MDERELHDLDALANAYLRLHAEKRNEDEWAFDQLWDMVREQPQRALEVTLILIKKAGNDDAALAYVAAGPLEDLLKLHGPQVIDRIERESKNNSRIQLALSGVLGSSWSSRIRAVVRTDAELGICGWQTPSTLMSHTTSDKSP